MNKQLSLIVLSLLLASCSSLPNWMGGKPKPVERAPGERTLALPIDSVLAADAATKATPANIPTPAANADWPQHSGVFTAATGNLAAGNLEHKDSARAGDGNDYTQTLLVRPVVGGGMVFSMDAKAIISARAVGNIGKEIWQSKSVYSKGGDEIIGGGMAFDNGVLYVTSGYGYVSAIEAATGKEIWRKDFHIPFRAAPHINGEMLLVMTIDNQLYAMNAKTGTVMWDHRGINETAGIMNSVSPSTTGGAVLVPYSSGELFALSANDGKEAWSDALAKMNHTQATSVFNGIGGDLVIDGNVVFATSSNGVTAAIYIPQGNRLWQQQASSVNAPWLAGDELFLLTVDNVLIDMTKYTGKIRWSAQLPSYIDPDLRLKPIGWYGPVMANGKLYIAGSHGKMMTFSATDGTVLETLDIPKDVYTAPVVAGGRLYLVSQDATLYEFQ